MIIGLPKEIKNNEFRIALTPFNVKRLIDNGHEVLVEKDAGEGSGFTDTEYRASGARLIDSAEEVWNSAEMVMKVKEPLEEEYKYFRKGLVLFTYLHLSAAPELTKALADNEVTAIGYETVTKNGTLPLLTPMSEVAGRMAVQLGAHHLEKKQGGKGLLLGGVPGVEKGTVTIIGGGVVGENAARMAVGMRAKVNILELNPERMRELIRLFGNDVQTLASTPSNIEKAVKKSDLVIGSVLIPGHKAPKLVTEDMVKSMEKGSVIVDVAIDQGGNFETLDEPTTHDEPTFIKHGVVHYGVANIPGAVPRTATLALTNDTIRYALQLANKGVVEAMQANEGLAAGMNVYKGKVTNEAVANDLGLAYTELSSLF
ncbi:L-alanine dehydrogenase [Alkalibacterium putridalgicola]|uniref:Alanine dehydrogenase n=1 Tax=Alkalibacterium putridalgicola TaxID=426703 RepID=A0A1H7X7Z4_9LACT|nr:alanine dehydrogenase [Alkalibacterium putridalgicola]GEK90071.1 alanine dehydrogenase [Alkalibacterium putridalgicola]SEM29793.1 L-alanine dehydrogenase [Alkalibacterium putridalgicola]